MPPLANLVSSMISRAIPTHTKNISPKIQFLAKVFENSQGEMRQSPSTDRLIPNALRGQSSNPKQNFLKPEVPMDFERRIRLNEPSIVDKVQRLTSTSLTLSGSTLGESSTEDKAPQTHELQAIEKTVRHVMLEPISTGSSTDDATEPTPDANLQGPALLIPTPPPDTVSSNESVPAASMQSANAEEQAAPVALIFMASASNIPTAPPPPPKHDFRPYAKIKKSIPGNPQGIREQLFRQDLQKAIAKRPMAPAIEIFPIAVVAHPPIQKPLVLKPEKAPQQKEPKELSPRAKAIQARFEKRDRDNQAENKKSAATALKAQQDKEAHDLELAKKMEPVIQAPFVANPQFTPPPQPITNKENGVQKVVAPVAEEPSNQTDSKPAQKIHKAKNKKERYGDVISEFSESDLFQRQRLKNEAAAQD